MATLVEQFTDLFQGNQEAIGTEDGGCWRIVEAPWEAFIRWHLTGERQPIGVYPMVDRDPWGPGGSWAVHWGCVDFDEGEEESWAHAKNVYLALRAYDVAAWIERSRSKGYHVWVFADDWVPAETMRNALLAACQCVEAPRKEVNPKQVQLQAGQLGNYVRLPYPGWLGVINQVKQRRVVVHPDDPSKILLFSEFVRKAQEARTPLGTLETLAGAYTPPERPIRRREWDGQPTYDDDRYARLRGKALVIFSQGPLEGSGRGHTLYKLACYLHEDGRHTKAEALELVREADARWGKFFERPDCDLRLQELVDRAWG